MARKRMVAGYNLQTDGILAPGEPIKAKATVPDNAKILCMRIDPQGNFILFCEVWSHPEGTKVNFRDIDFLMVPPQGEIAAGKWEWFDSLAAGPGLYHIYSKDAEPQLVLQ